MGSKNRVISEKTGVRRTGGVIRSFDHPVNSTANAGLYIVWIERHAGLRGALLQHQPYAHTRAPLASNNSLSLIIIIIIYYWYIQKYHIYKDGS